SLDSSKNLVARMQADWTGIDPAGPRVESLIKMMADKRIALDPTLSIQRIDSAMRKQLGLEQFALAEDSFKRMGEFVARGNKAGVRLLAGTDDGSLFDELEAYAAAGISNKDILASATINGARWLGKDALFGTLEVGKAANLILIDGDPLKDIKDLRKLKVVV